MLFPKNIFRMLKFSINFLQKPKICISDFYHFFQNYILKLRSRFYHPICFRTITLQDVKKWLKKCFCWIIRCASLILRHCRECKSFLFSAIENLYLFSAWEKNATKKLFRPFMKNKFEILPNLSVCLFHLASDSTAFYLNVNIAKHPFSILFSQWNSGCQKLIVRDYQKLQLVLTFLQFFCRFSAKVLAGFLPQTCQLAVFYISKYMQSMKYIDFFSLLNRDMPTRQRVDLLKHFSKINLSLSKSTGFKFSNEVLYIILLYVEENCIKPISILFLALNSC